MQPTKPTFGDRRRTEIDMYVAAYQDAVKLALTQPGFMWPTAMKKISTDEDEWRDAVGRAR